MIDKPGRKRGGSAAGRRSGVEEVLREIRLLVVDPESGASKVIRFDEAKSWDWSSQELVRLVDGWEVRSLDQLAQVLLYKVSKGHQEVKVYEAPRAMLLGGG